MRPGFAVPVLLVVGLLALAACSEAGARLVDESGAVSEWRYHPAPAVVGFSSPDEFAAMEAAGALPVTAPEGWDVRVVWGASPCQTQPTIRVRGSATAITAIEVDHGPPTDRNCASSLELHAVDLRTTAATTDAVVSGAG